MAVDYYLRGRVQIQLGAHLFDGVYVSVGLALCTITRSRDGQQEQQSLRLGHRRS